MDLLLEAAPIAVEGGFLLAALVFLNKKIDGVRADVYTQLNNGIKDELTAIKTDVAGLRGYMDGKKESR